MMFLLIIPFTFLVFLLFMSLYHMSIRLGRNGRLIDKIPGPKTLPIIGNTHIFLVPLENLWSVVQNLNKEYYPIVRFWRFNYPVVNVLHPDDVEVVLSSMKHIEKSSNYDFLQPWLGTGLLTSTGKKWQTRRKILTPSFHFNMLQEFVQTFDEEGKRLVASMKSANPLKESRIIDVVPFVTKHTLNLICETAMGTVIDGSDKEQNGYRQSVYEMGDIVLYRLLRPWTFVDPIFKLTKKGRNQDKNLQILHGFTNRIIAERKQYHEMLNREKSKETAEEEEESSFTKGRKKMAMLDLLISAWRNGRKIDDEGIREEVDTFMFRGHDTTAMALTFILLCMAEYKNHQDRCREEINGVFEQSDGKLGIPELQQLCYLERCIKESLRLYPSVPTISRKTNEDMHLKDYVIPPETSVQLRIFDIHRDPNFWPNPEAYDPDRFLPDNSVNRHPYSYVPFSAGPRNCIGQKFAMMELKTIVSYILHEFYLEPIDSRSDLRFLPDIILRPLNPVRVKFIPIH